MVLTGIVIYYFDGGLWDDVVGHDPFFGFSGDYEDSVGEI